jgi:hypothetical protein
MGAVAPIYPCVPLILIARDIVFKQYRCVLGETNICIYTITLMKTKPIQSSDSLNYKRW